ncbi:N-acetylmuramoyl-L-alanine amidase [Streptomyces sp. NL15-2K]|uniref:N-acetylmuramoyl-L-alanine amidase n=1 Tax=Streptomyces sp. NL15-2K TaxID=376149 RepID=UPI00209C5C83|nr:MULTISPECIES: N-acetylmuramoyl-L-alanine amidase [Actinomycetes]WKX09682.1 N-acetylmuramoyl-L-alanine amidase [Kutzneria buriramensis]
MRRFLASSIGVTCTAALALPLLSPTATASVPVTTAARPVSSAEPPGSTQSLPLAPLTRDRVAGAPAEQGLPRRDVRRFSLVGVVWDSPETELHGRVQVRTRAAGSDTWSGWQDIEPHNAEHAADPDTLERTSGRVRGATAPLWVGASDGVEVRVKADAEHRLEETAEGTRTTTVVSPLPSGLHLELIDPGDEPPPAQQPPAAAPNAAPNAEPADDAATDDVTTDDVITDDVATDDVTTEDVATEDVATEDVATEDVATEDVTTEDVTTEDVTTEDAATEDAATEDVATEDASTEDLAAEDASAANTDLAPLGATEIPELSRYETEQELFTLKYGELTQEQLAKPYIGPRPRIVTRRGWGADEKLREKQFIYTKKVKAAFVHHTASGNAYTCAQAPSVIRGIYRYHVKSMGWRDIGYNFLVDKCGNIYEGRAGGVAKPVMGAHTLGFNSNSMGVAVLGSYGSSKPSAAAVNGIARLTAWKLGLHGANPRGKTYLKSAGGNLYPKGKNVRLNVISGHRDGFATSCPGGQLYRKLGTARADSARYQGR